MFARATAEAAGNGATVPLTNCALPRRPGRDRERQDNTAQCRSFGQSNGDAHRPDCANAKRRRQDTGEPDYLDAAQLAELNDTSRMGAQEQPLRLKDGKIELEVEMPPLPVASATLHFPASAGA